MQVLAGMVASLGDAVERERIDWPTLTDVERRSAALRMLQTLPILWIWDGVENIAGLPGRAASVWNGDVQHALLEFLKDAVGTGAKFLLTSRRSEHAWLGDLPRRVELMPMFLRETAELAHALAVNHGSVIQDMKAWYPLLRFVSGNPHAASTLVRNALRSGLATRQEIAAFVDELRSDEWPLDKCDIDVQRRPLPASLVNAFEHALTLDEQKQLTLLYPFQGFVDVQAICSMSYPGYDWCVPNVEHLTRDAGIALLDRAVDIGLLEAEGNGFYVVHPAASWLLKRLFDASDSDLDSPFPKKSSITLAFIETMGGVGAIYDLAYTAGDPRAVSGLIAEEQNLLHAWRLARERSQHIQVIGTMQGLFTLYKHTGRWKEWADIVVAVIPDFVDPSGDPMPGLGDEWSVVMRYRANLALRFGKLDEASCILQTLVHWHRDHLGDTTNTPPNILTRIEEYDIGLIASLSELGALQMEINDSECIATLMSALKHAEQVGERSETAPICRNIAVAYLRCPSVQDLDHAEIWCTRALMLCELENRRLRANCLSDMGAIAHRRFREAYANRLPEEVLAGHMTDAYRFYSEAIELTPPDAVTELAPDYRELGAMLFEANNVEAALSCCRKALRCYEVAENVYRSANVRHTIAVGLGRAGRFNEALEYANAALRSYEACGEKAAAEVRQIEKLIGQIERDIGSTRG